jgi:hypothetical protein
MPTTEELAAIAQREMGRERARAVLMENRETPFVRRILNPRDYPAIWDEKGKPRTVRLGTYGFDGTDWVVPEVVYQGSQLIEGSGPDWARRQIDRGNAISFPDLAQAKEFAEGEDSWKLLFKSRGGDLIDDPTERPPRNPVAPASPLEDALRRAMSNSPLALGPGSYPALP